MINFIVSCILLLCFQYNNAETDAPLVETEMMITPELKLCINSPSAAHEYEVLNGEYEAIGTGYFSTSDDGDSAVFAECFGDDCVGGNIIYKHVIESEGNSYYIGIDKTLNTWIISQYPPQWSSTDSVLVQCDSSSLAAEITGCNGYTGRLGDGVDRIKINNGDCSAHCSEELNKCNSNESGGSSKARCDDLSVGYLIYESWGSSTDCGVRQETDPSSIWYDPVCCTGNAVSTPPVTAPTAKPTLKPIVATTIPPSIAPSTTRESAKPICIHSGWRALDYEMLNGEYEAIGTGHFSTSDNGDSAVFKTCSGIDCVGNNDLIYKHTLDSEQYMYYIGIDKTLFTWIISMYTPEFADADSIIIQCDPASLIEGIDACFSYDGYQGHDQWGEHGINRIKIDYGHCSEYCSEELDKCVIGQHGGSFKATCSDSVGYILYESWMNSEDCGDREETDPSSIQPDPVCCSGRN